MSLQKFSPSITNAHTARERVSHIRNVVKRVTQSLPCEARTCARHGTETIVTANRKLGSGLKKRAQLSVINFGNCRNSNRFR